jgi:DNA/RNA-binding domain of Phe-tRNA-synthetase-like protein
MISISNELLEKVPGLFVKTKILENVSVKLTPQILQEKKAELIKKWEGKTAKDLDSIEQIISYRNLQSKFGQDPKIQLPAVENMLVRGILQGKFPTINSAVDSANIISIENLIPIGLFDFDKITGGIELRLAGETDQFIPIGKTKPEKIKAGLPVLSDSEKIFSAIGVRDSEATKIMSSSKRLLILSWGIGSINEQKIEQVLEKASLLIKKEVG